MITLGARVFGLGIIVLALVCLAVLMDARVVVAHYSEYVIYSSVAAQVAVAAGALILYGGR